GHGFGFLGSMDITDGLGNWGWDTGFPEVYDLYAINGAGQSLLNTSLFPNYSTALASQLKSNNIYLNGANAKSANGGTRVPIYAPSTWKPGSSYSHLAESYNGTSNALMTYSLSMGEAIHNPGPVTLGVLTDVGWNIQSKLSTTTTLTSSKNPSTPGQSVTLTAKVSTSSGTPTGTVTFKDGTTTLGTGSLSSGQAKFTTTSLSAGTHSITAVYGGSTGYLTSTSSTLKQVVNLLPLGTPGNLTATAIGSSSSSVVTVKLNWKDNSSAENRFYIERQLYWGGAWSVLGYVGANITTYTDTPPFGFVYNYRVRAWNTTAGYSAYSNVVNPASPNAPSNLTVVAKTNVQFTLNWKDNSTNETGFLIAYRDATKNGSWAYIKALYSPNTTTANLVGGTSGDVYQFAVVSVGPGGLSNFSNIASITAISSTGSQGASSLIQPENGVLDLNFQLPEITINS
ncbi:hypothetical protein HGB07_08825, partial [Candidatus Roizmanbacteria bacterium]|nr:hypothetical protein [Candidatus Roizmanbacteria bacterium]